MQVRFKQEGNLPCHSPWESHHSIPGAKNSQRPWRGSSEVHGRHNFSLNLKSLFWSGLVQEMACCRKWADECLAGPCLHNSWCLGTSGWCSREERPLETAALQPPWLLVRQPHQDVTSREKSIQTIYPGLIMCLASLDSTLISPSVASDFLTTLGEVEQGPACAHENLAVGMPQGKSTLAGFASVLLPRL